MVEGFLDCIVFHKINITTVCEIYKLRYVLSFDPYWLLNV